MDFFLKTIKRNYFLLILTFVIGFVGVLPLIIKPTSPFYAFDPDPAYVANGIEFLQIHKFFFVDHPGTPMAFFLSLVFFPVKIFERVVHPGSFVFWSLQHFEVFMWIARFSVFAIFLTGIYIFQLTFYKLFKSYLVNLFLSMTFFLIPNFFYFQGLVTPENFGLFFTSIWFYFIAKYKNLEKFNFLVIASVFSGLAAASKLTFIIVFVSTFILSFYQKSIVKSLTVIAGFFAGFILGTLPVLTKHEAFNRWISYLLTRQSPYNSSQLISVNWFGANYIFLILIAVLGFIVFSKKGMRVFGVIFLSGFLGLSIIEKYSTLHYQFANFLLIALCLTVLFSQLNKKAMVLVLILLSFFSIGQIKSDFISKRFQVMNSANIQKYADALPLNGFYIWDIVGSKEYALIRGKEWSNWFYLPELKTYKPRLWYLYPFNLGVMVNNEGQRYSIDDFCWDGLFLNEYNLKKFLNQQKNPENYKKIKISGTDNFFVTQIKCSNAPHPRSLNI